MVEGVQQGLVLVGTFLGVDGFQVSVALLRVQGDPHLVVVANFGHDH